jgi:hypothetical protein
LIGQRYLRLVAFLLTGQELGEGLLEVRMPDRPHDVLNLKLGRLLD